MRGYRQATAGLAALLLTASGAWADNPPNDQIDVGIFTAVEGKVAVTHPGIQKSVPVKLQDGVLFKDIIETEKESRTKALLNDDSILTVGEHSRVEITEHIYDPNKGVRSVVVNLVKGQVRALVGKVFSGSGSKFEIHTPAAVAAARGTYFIVFHINGVSGIVNVGTHGHVDFSSGGRSVTVPPGQFSSTPPGGGPPSTPTVNTGNSAPSQVTNAVKGTEVKDSPKEESPKQMAMSSGGTAPVSSPSSLTPPGTSGSGGGDSSSSSARNPTASTTITTPTTTLTTTVSVPAVISGAAGPTATETTSEKTGGDTGGTQEDPLPTRLKEFFGKLLTSFSALADRVEDKEATRIEREYAMALNEAELLEKKKVDEATTTHKDGIYDIDQAFNKNIYDLEENLKKNTITQAQFDEQKLNLEMLKAQNVAALDLWKANELIKIMDARKLFLQQAQADHAAKIAKISGWELRKLNKAGNTYVNTVRRAGENYLAKLARNGADEATLLKNRAAVDKAIRFAEANVAAAKLAAVQDDIQRGIQARIGKEHFGQRNYTRWSSENFNRFKSEQGKFSKLPPK